MIIFKITKKKQIKLIKELRSIFESNNIYSKLQSLNSKMLEANFWQDKNNSQKVIDIFKSYKSSIILIYNLCLFLSLYLCHNFFSLCYSSLLLTDIVHMTRHDSLIFLVLLGIYFVGLRPPVFFPFYYTLFSSYIIYLCYMYVKYQ